MTSRSSDDKLTPFAVILKPTVVEHPARVHEWDVPSATHPGMLERRQSEELVLVEATTYGRSYYRVFIEDGHLNRVMTEALHTAPTLPMPTLRARLRYLFTGRF